MASPYGWWQTRVRLLSRVVLSTSLFFALVPTQGVAQDTEDPAFVQRLVQEVVNQITLDAYKLDPKPVIYTKALAGLAKQLGGAAAAEAKDLTTMIDEAAEQEYFRILKALSEAPGQRLSYRELAERSIQEYCKQHDDYTRYIRTDEAKLIKNMSQPGSSSVGMSVMEKGGAFYCYPIQGSPAEAAGIKNGTKLLSVDGKPVQDRPLPYLAALIRGAPGSEVSLRVEHTFGRAQTVRVTRETLTMPAVIAEKRMGGMTLKVRKFTKEMLGEVRTALAGLSAGNTLTIDLQGCPGGDLDVAEEFAGMFLEPGEQIVTERYRGKPDKVISATKPREFKPVAVILVQDGGTASGSELVIAALVNSTAARGRSSGAKSFGKGVTQTATDLRAGGYLVITSGELIAPQGQTWDKTGLLPSADNRGRIFERD